MLKKAWKIVLAAVLALLVVVLGYVAYVFIDYHRIGDQELTVEWNAAATVETGKEYGILSYNIGFGAYEDDYSFFMDGGTESRAWSEERLTANIERIGAFLQQQDADLYLLQEVDRDSTRSYHVDEVAMLTAQLPGLGYIWAQNYDSPYLFYPLDQPHGKSVSGLLMTILVTALVTGLVQFIFFPGTALLGASGVVFMMIVLNSFTEMRRGGIPLTMLLVVALYLGNEVVDGLSESDNISQMTHIVGGLCGIVFGFSLARAKKR